MSAASVETIDMLLYKTWLTAQTADEDDLGTLRALITSNAPINESLRGEKKVVRPCVACESKQRLAVSLDYLRYSYFVACYLPRAASDDTTPSVVVSVSSMSEVLMMSFLNPETDLKSSTNPQQIPNSRVLLRVTHPQKPQHGSYLFRPHDTCHENSRTWSWQQSSTGHRCCSRGPRLWKIDDCRSGDTGSER
jgi:hypothetical protein